MEQKKSIPFDNFHINWSGIFLPTVRKIVVVSEKNSRLKAENLQDFWDHKNNLFKIQVKKKKKKIVFEHSINNFFEKTFVWFISNR